VTLRTRFLQGFIWAGTIPLLSLGQLLVVNRALKVLGIQAGLPQDRRALGLVLWLRFTVLWCLSALLYFVLLPVWFSLAATAQAGFTAVACPAAAVANEGWLKAGVRAGGMPLRAPLRFLAGYAIIALSWTPVLLLFVIGMSWMNSVLPAASLAIAFPLAGVGAWLCGVTSWVFGVVFWARSGGQAGLANGHG
jgi:hypothetical protein